MSILSRRFLISLLLVLVLSNAAFVAHAASHLSGEFVECELCIAHSPLSHALAADGGTSLLPYGGAIVDGHLAPTPATTFIHSCQARGPPAINR